MLALQEPFTILTMSKCWCQDERVMQLFGLVNTMLANDRVTARA